MTSMSASADWLRFLERSEFGDAVRTIPYFYPLLECLHIFGIALLVGSAVAVDLRLLGVARSKLRVTDTTRYLLPLSRSGFALAATSGVTMFIGVAQSVGASSAGRWKLGLLLVAAINILAFHRGVYKRIDAWDLDVTPPLAAKLAALISVGVWAAVIVAGRFIAY